MIQNEALLPAEAGIERPAESDSAEQIQAEQATVSTEQTGSEMVSTEQTGQAFRWDKIATWPADIVIFLIIAGTALCVLRLRRTQFELWFGKTGFLYGNLLLILASLMILCLFIFRGCHGEF